MSLAQTMATALDLPDQGVLAIVGAGGKTSAMYRLARELVSQGRRVLCTTTTKIFPPTWDQGQLMLRASESQWLEKCAQFSGDPKPLVLGEKQAGAKVLGLSPALIQELIHAQIFDWILVEADGARGLPLKAPAAHEPVIPQVSSHVLGMVGLKAVGQPLSKTWVFHSEIYAQLTGLAMGAVISAQSVVQLVNHPLGLFKNSPVQAKKLLWLNQADDPQALVQGREIVQLVQGQKSWLQRIVLGTATGHPSVLEVGA